MRIVGNPRVALTFAIAFILSNRTDGTTFYSLDRSPHPSPVHLVQFESGAAQGPTVINDIPGVLSDPNRIAMGQSLAGLLFVAPYGSTVFEIDPNNGSVLDSFATDGGLPIEGLAVSSDGLVYVYQEQGGGRVWKINFDTHESVQIGTVGELDDLGFDGDGNLIGHDLNQGGRIVRLSLDGSPSSGAELIATLPPVPVSGWAFSEQDSAFYVIYNDIPGTQQLWRLPWQNGAPAGEMTFVRDLGPGWFVGIATVLAPMGPITHIGSLNPQGEGWTFGNQDGTSAPVHGDLGYVEAWRIETDAINAQCWYDYLLSSALVEDAFQQGWSLTAVVRVARSDAGSGSVIYFASGSHVHSIQLRTNSNGDPIVGLIDENLHSQEISGGADKYHVYQLRDSEGSGLVDLYVDGAHVFNDVETPAYPPFSARITFGDVVGGLPINSDASYALIKFEVGTVDPTHGCQGNSIDCNGNGLLDPCDLRNGTSADCNENGVPDECDVIFGTADDCNGNQIPDQCEGISSISFDLPTGSIDARQPTSLDGSVAFGWQFIEVSFNETVFDLSPTDFVVTQEGGTGLTPDILFVLPNDEDSVSLLLSSPISLGAWTTITHSCSGISTRIGYLPGDVNSDGTSRPLDILSLIDSLNAVGELRPIWSTDIDRSGQSNPADILRLIDLLNGAEAFEVWHGSTLP